MINVHALQGTQVRDVYGLSGRVLGIVENWVRLAWNRGSAIQEENLLRTDPRVSYQIEALTLDRGWMPLGHLIGVAPGQAVYEDVQSLMGEAQLLTEAGKHHPFKRASVLKRGIRGRTLKKSDHWTCKKSGAYSQLCKGKGDMKGRTKKVKIDPAYKASYNSEYKPCASSGKCGIPSKKSKKAKKKG